MGDVVVIDPVFSSISEIITQLLIDLGFLGDPDSFQNLLDGISYATRNFTSPQTSAFAFEAAGFLLQNGARRKSESQSPARGIIPGSFPADDQFFQPSSGATAIPARPVQSTRQNRPVPNNFPGNFPNMPTQPFPRNTSAPVAPVKNSQNFQDLPPDFAPQSAPKEMTADSRDMPDEMPYTEGSVGTEVPEDWFLPKVFKGSKKGN